MAVRLASNKATSTSKPATTSKADIKAGTSTKGGSSSPGSQTASIRVSVGFKSPSVALQPSNQVVTAKYRPWDPTRILPRKLHYSRRMGFLMQALEEEQTQRAQTLRKFPDFRAGDILEITMMVPENERKKYVYKGVCIARYNKGIRSAFKIYNVFPESGGMVQHVPLFMPDLLSIKVVGHVKASGNKLFKFLEDQTTTHVYQNVVRPGA
eukprot:CAMPEP_0202912112 /NCGR_PEP_ID=MMETSP1392-20130828/56867_1 /ASSEMBLY_ACC=CAM_ASM_000868 /TAXON_ID=225041 /ORGANISM="Chlamydomonas chlamydogama, Strain SAG 11-48b" /LENGTH=209 /DNA_ID=CAMNT_0049602907 /DNA_START=212 /DNA_END=841 /DNA_ORIENTATION=-